MHVIAKANVEIANKEVLQFRQLCDTYRGEFKVAVTEAVSNGTLPKSALDNLSRVDTVNFAYRDAMYMISSSVDGTAGEHGGITANGSSLTKPRVLRHVVFHELMHEIAGKTLELETTSQEGWGDQIRVTTDKSGLVFQGGGHGMWINEAITEKLALMLDGYQNGKSTDYGESPYYQDERKEVDRLLDFAGSTKDKLWEMMLTAYFENVRNDQNANDLTPKFQTLILNGITR